MLDQNHPDYLLEYLVYALGGVVGELAARKKVLASGLGGRDDADLPLAYALAKRILNQTTPAQLERRWAGRLTDPSFDVAAMFVQRPAPDVAAMLNLGYRRGKQLLLENLAGFDRLCRQAAGRRDLSRRDIESQFGPRPWAPQGR